MRRFIYLDTDTLEIVTLIVFVPCIINMLNTDFIKKVKTVAIYARFYLLILNS